MGVCDRLSHTAIEEGRDHPAMDESQAIAVFSLRLKRVSPNPVRSLALFEERAIAGDKFSASCKGFEPFQTVVVSAQRFDPLICFPRAVVSDSWVRMYF